MSPMHSNLALLVSKSKVQWGQWRAAHEKKKRARDEGRAARSSKVILPQQRPPQPHRWTPWQQRRTPTLPPQSTQATQAASPSSKDTSSCLLHAPPLNDPVLGKRDYLFILPKLLLPRGDNSQRTYNQKVKFISHSCQTALRGERFRGKIANSQA